MDCQAVVPTMIGGSNELASMVAQQLQQQEQQQQQPQKALPQPTGPPQPTGMASPDDFQLLQDVDVPVFVILFE